MTDPSPSLSLPGDDRRRVLDRYRERLLEAPTREAAELRDLLASLDDGRFPDVDYDDRAPPGWEPTRALERVVDLARAYRDDDHPLGGDRAVRDGAVRALAYWLDRDPRSDNWWHNDIGAPGVMCEVVALAGPWLEKEVRTAALAVLGRVDADGTGANLLWTAEIEFLYGCFAGETDRALEAARQAIEEVRVTTDEGIQPDYSFHQHGPAFQQFHYGQSFVETAASFAALVCGTDCAFPPDRRELLAELVLEGHRWMQRAGVVSPATLDRAVSRQGALRVDATAFRRLAELAEGRPDELDAFADHVAAGPPADGTPVVGHRHYWRSDFTVDARPGAFVSLKTVSERTHNTESINEENLRGRYLTAGALYVTRAGDEYLDLFPVWDWTLVPGVTAYADRLVEPDRRAFAGGLAVDGDGVDAMDYGVTDGDLEARKAWFFHDGTVVCLGSGVAATDGPVRTALAQRRRRGAGAVGSESGERTLEPGTETTATTRWLHHDGVGYVFPEPAEVTVSTRERTGSWHDINRSYDDEPVAEPTFAAWLDHGDRPTGESYAYALVPDATADRAADLAADPPVEVVANEPTRQAVRFPGEGVVGAAFHEPGTVRAGGTDIGVDAPALVRTDGDTVTVADPERRGGSVTVEIDGQSVAVDVGGTPDDPPQGTADLPQ